MNALFLYTAQGVINSRSKNYGCNVRPFTILDDSEDNESGGTSLEFPIYLVEGDNGQVGVDLYTYLLEHYPNIPFSETPNNIENITEEIYVDETYISSLDGRVLGISLVSYYDGIALWTEGSKDERLGAVLVLTSPLSEYGSSLRRWYWN
jgi:hypothetical protein